MDYHLPDRLPIYFDKIYLVCGYTDLRKQIDGLLEIVTIQYSIRASRGQLFLFCGGRCDRIKLLLYDGQSYSYFSNVIDCVMMVQNKKYWNINLTTHHKFYIFFV